jgi:hypothetical protein
VALLIRTLKKFSVRKLRLADFFASKRTIEPDDVDEVAGEFGEFLVRALEAGEEEVPVVELEQKRIYRIGQSHLARQRCHCEFLHGTRRHSRSKKLSLRASAVCERSNPHVDKGGDCFDAQRRGISQ